MLDDKRFIKEEELNPSTLGAMRLISFFTWWISPPDHGAPSWHTSKQWVENKFVWKLFSFTTIWNTGETDDINTGWEKDF